MKIENKKKPNIRNSFKVTIRVNENVKLNLVSLKMFFMK